MLEIFHIELIEPGGRVVRRTSVRTSVEVAKERARRVFQRSQAPQARDIVEAVRLLNGAGYELLSISARD